MRAAVQQLREAHPGMRFVEAIDNASPVAENFDGSMAMLYEGALLAVIVVWIFLRDWREGNIDSLPFAPAGTAGVYAEYLAWCKRNGEPYPRPAKHFWATAGKPGWFVGRADRYVDIHSSTTVTWRCVIPPAALLARHASKEVLPREGLSKTKWLTECYFFVEEARQKAGLK